METRYIPFNKVEVRKADNGNPVIEGYFAKFGDVYNLFEGATESIAKGAFADSIGGDVRALYNHNSDIVLARTSADTLTLKEDEVGLWGRVELDPEDTDAMNVYRRIQRGSITGCSFGFEIEKEEREVKSDGSVHWTITKVNPLYEVSPVAFPAYESTSISARSNEFKAITDELRAKELESWKLRMKRRLSNGTKSTDAPQED